MKLIDLMEHISQPEETGLLKIKPFSEVNCDAIGQVVIAESKNINPNLHGSIRFGDDVWRETSSRSINFKGLPATFNYEIKAAALLATHSGIFEGGSGQKFNTTSLQITPLIKFGKYLHRHKIESLVSFNQMPILRKRNHFVNYITKEMELTRGDSFKNPRFFQEHMGYDLLTLETLKLFWEEIDSHGIAIDTQSKTTASYAVVPSGILKHIITECEQRLNDAEDVIDAWESVNNEFIDAIRNLSVHKKVNKSSAFISKKLGRIFNDRLRQGYEAFNNLKLNVLMYILAYTGMRKEEALSCKIGCAREKDGKYYIDAILTKTDEGEVELPWIANKVTYDAVKLLERYLIAMNKRAEVILEQHQGILNDSFKHRLKHGLQEKLIFGTADTMGTIRFTTAKLGAKSSDPYKDSKFTLHLFEYALTTQDIDQLESLNCNYKSVRGKNKGIKYKVGEIFHITAHMLRHNFAWFVIANRLGELDDIKHQFKHLASSMTMVYTARGYESPDEMISLFEEFEDMLVDNVAQDLAQEAADGTLSGAGGKRLNNAAKDLTFNVTGSNSSDTGRTIKQIHFKDLNSYKEFLVHNLRNIRGLPHGYCTRGSECKLKNVGIPSGCVYCPNYVVTERQRVHWHAMKKFADEKLAIYSELTESEQEEYSLLAQGWRETTSAASIILTDSKPLKVEGSTA
jgi:integrase